MPRSNRTSYAVGLGALILAVDFKSLEIDKSKLPSPVILALNLKDILSDYEWHNSEEIAQELHSNPSYIRRILGDLKEVWNLEAKQKKGFRLPRPENNTSI
ncbi:MAG: hypothetical protein WBB28_01235 [Crinalium sp.]